MKATTLLAAVLFTAVSSVVHAEELDLGDYINGNWTIVGSTGGEDVKGTMTVRPAANGETRFFRWTLNSADGVQHGTAIGGIDPASGKVVEHGFSEDAHWTNTYDKVLGDTIGKTTGVRKGVVAGQPFEGQITVERTSGDRFTYTIEANNQTVVDLVFERTKPATDGEEAFKAYAELAAGGTWVCNANGVTYEDTYEWIFDGKFLRMTSKSTSELPESVSILGVDPVTKKFTWWGYGADGSFSIGTSRQTKPGVWAGQLKGTGPAGSVTSRGRLKKIDDDTIEYTIVEQNVEGDAPKFPEVTIWKRKR